MRVFSKVVATAITAVIWMAVTGPPASAGDDSPVSVTVDATVVSRYMWRGYDVLDDHGAFQPSVDVALGDTGLSFNAWGSFALSGGFEALDEVDYTVAYSRSLFADSPFAVDFGINYIYFDFPKLNRKADTQEVGLGLAFPNLIPLGGSALVPSYSVAKLWPEESSNPGIAGWFHTLGLAYDLNLPCPVREEGQDLGLSAELGYNDGAFGADEDWTYASFGVAAPVNLGPVVVTPSIHYQVSMESTVNENKDEFWSGLSASVSF